MADSNQMLLYAASYDSAQAALAALGDIEQLHKDKMIGKYDAAVIDQQDGKPHLGDPRPHHFRGRLDVHSPPCLQRG